MSGLLGVPLGGPGSGRARYACAMALYQAGALTAAQLEGYRVAAAHDHQPPDAPFAERGLPLPEDAEPLAEAALRLLVAEADTYLSTLPGPGVAEVRQGIATARGGRFVPARPQPNAVVTAHLPAALAALAPQYPALASAIAGAQDLLDWITYDRYPIDQIGQSFVTGHAFASIMGERAVIEAPGFDLGLFLISPHLLYRDHHHAAPELYAPLTGPHGWRFGANRPLVLKPAHVPVWNPPHRPHLTKVGPTPFLCLFAWTAHVNEPAHILPAIDWPALEALRLS